MDPGFQRVPLFLGVMRPECLCKQSQLAKHNHSYDLFRCIDSVWALSSDFEPRDAAWRKGAEKQPQKMFCLTADD